MKPCNGILIQSLPVSKDQRAAGAANQHGGGDPTTGHGHRGEPGRAQPEVQGTQEARGDHER